VLVDDSLQLVLRGQTPWHRRGPWPILSASKVLTMEVVGELLGYYTDEGDFGCFYWHWLDLFPALAQVHRTDFLRQAARLMRVKGRLWRWLLLQLSWDPQVSIADSFSLYVCQFARAKCYRRFFG